MILLTPAWLWLLPLWLAALLIFRPKRAGARYRPGSVLQFSITALAFLCLIFAAAGLSFQQTVRKTQLVVAADVSDSIFQLDDQSTRLRELIAAVDPETTELALVVFAKTQALERPMGPPPLAIDLAHRTAVIDTRATNLADALQFSASAFSVKDGARGVLVLSDFRDIGASPLAVRANAAALDAAGISLLATPAVLSAGSDVRLAELRAPDRASIARAVPLDITIAAQKPAEVKVRVARAAVGRAPVFIDSKIVKLEAAKNSNATELRQTVRILDHPPAPGVAVYTATLSGPEGPLPGDVLINNSLSAAVRIDGPSKWSVLARSDSTLARLAQDPAKPLGVECVVFAPGKFPEDAAAYIPFSGILVDGLSASEFPQGSPALRALETAVLGGKALVAFGGTTAFGAGGHPAGGTFETILPIELTPEDTRARSVLFLLDISSSMDERFTPRGGSKMRKLDFADSELQVVQQLRPRDRLGLIEFSGSARVTVPLASEPTRSAFLDELRAIKTDSSTDIFAAIERARAVLEGDNAEEQLVILISDGIQTVNRPREEIIRAVEALCPPKPNAEHRRTKVLTFGIGIENESANAVGEKLLQDLAAAGGGIYSARFEELGKKLRDIIDQDKQDFFIRREAFVPQAAQGAELFSTGAAWPELHFRNRVRAKPGADVPLFSHTEKSASRPDPLLALSGPGDDSLARRAVLALTLDGPEGTALLAPGSAGRTLPALLLSWAEAREERGARGYTLLAEPTPADELDIELRAFNPADNEPVSTLRPQAQLTILQAQEERNTQQQPAPFELKANAPGTYRARVSAPPASVCRITVRDGVRTLAERFVSTPCSAEARQFGVNRAAMSELVAAAGTNARSIESPRDLANWAAAQKFATGAYDLRPWLIAVALILLMLRWSSRLSG